VVFGAAALIETHGGLIGPAVQKCRLPVLTSLFRFRGLEAVILIEAANRV
jgi:hypothetical protein